MDETLAEKVLRVLEENNITFEEIHQTYILLLNTEEKNA